MRVAAGGCGSDGSGFAGEGGRFMSGSRVRIGLAALTCSPATDHAEEPMRPGRFAARCSLALSLLVAMALGFVSSACSADPVPNPAVSGPIEGGVHGYPWNHSLFALRGPGYDYTEQEFFFSGMATDLSTGVQAPYESRMLVRLPRNPSGRCVIPRATRRRTPRRVPSIPCEAWPYDGSSPMGRPNRRPS